MNAYSFPDTIGISQELRNLITRILVTSPK